MTIVYVCLHVRKIMVLNFVLAKNNRYLIPQLRICNMYSYINIFNFHLFTDKIHIGLELGSVLKHLFIHQGTDWGL